MKTVLRLEAVPDGLKGTIVLEPSKSLCNRALIIRSLCEKPFNIQPLSTGDDTRHLVRMLDEKGDTLFAGQAGTGFRFMLARACLYDKVITLDAAPQMRRRPIGPLVRALHSIGAGIEYLGKEGFPPVKISPSNDIGKKAFDITLHSGISSQYITALLLIAPKLPNGLIIHLAEKTVSTSYIRMTLAMMEAFGISTSFDGDTIEVKPGEYLSNDFFVEADWSAASYYYALVALSPKAHISIEGLGKNSLQGDAVVAEIFLQFGVQTTYTDKGIVLAKMPAYKRPASFSYDFTNCPDLAQTVMVVVAGLGIRSELHGLRTLRIKETDRLAAMQQELARVKVTMEISEKENDVSAIIVGKAKWKDRGRFHTHDDHRMAMALSALGAIRPIVIIEHDVVSKSYPGFWEDLQRIGIVGEKQKPGKGE